MSNNVQHVTVEATSKKHKLHKLYAWSLFFVSLMLIFIPTLATDIRSSDPNPAAGAAALVGILGWLASAVWLTVIKIQVWWNHG